MQLSISEGKKENTKGYRVYRLPGIDKPIIARKGGPSEEQVKNSAAYAKLRKNQLEFGIASKVSKLVRESLPSAFKEILDPYVSARLTACFRKIVQTADGETGKRPMQIRTHSGPIEGFSLGKGPRFGDIFKAKFHLREGAYRGQFIFHFPSFVPTDQIERPDHASHFRFLAHAITLSDQVFADNEAGYRAVVPDEHGLADSIIGELRPIWRMPLDPITEQLSLKNENGSWSDQTAIIIMLGIRFYTFRDLHYHAVDEQSAFSVYRVY
jgi:hypothetical protein